MKRKEKKEKSQNPHQRALGNLNQMFHLRNQKLGPTKSSTLSAINVSCEHHTGVYPGGGECRADSHSPCVGCRHHESSL